MQNNSTRLLWNCNVNSPANYKDFSTIPVNRILSVVGLGCMDDGYVTEYPLDGVV